MSSSPPPLPRCPPCVLFNCPKRCEFEFNRRLLCAGHFEQLSRSSAPPPPVPAPSPAASVRTPEISFAVGT
ncbi:hypothetical protein PF002_g14389 [Phytophthora fragariae]|uniref:Uncharacterized protein n=1 Tax=Phytophthora fragariae TaxID=53985 RepID=A0A6A3YY02_9STRA|nr:hypothetical protein PF002_g14389 [Phytophthora fragariae]